MSVLMAQFFDNFPPVNISTTATPVPPSTTGFISTTGVAPQVPTFYAVPSETGFVSIIDGIGSEAIKIGDNGGSFFCFFYFFQID